MDRDYVYSVVDVETTGLSAQHDRVTEIAVVKVHRGQIIHTFSSLINPERPIPPFIQQMTGITDSMVRNAPRFGEVGEHLAGLLDGTVLVAHNARFDYGFLQAEFGRCSFELPETPLVDTVPLARKSIKGLANYRLSTLCEHLGLAQGGHRALGDATATAYLLMQLLADGAEEQLLKRLERAAK